MDKKLRMGMMFLAVVGFLDSMYLAWSKLTQRAVFCGGSSQCETVNTSIYSEFWGIPIALLGVGAYLLIGALLLLETRGNVWKESSRLAVFGLSLVGVIYSLYLTYVEIAILKAICPYCVVSAIAILGIFLLSVVRVMDFKTDLSPIRVRGD